jgi:RNA recognition motif-containing protein
MPAVINIFVGNLDASVTEEQLRTIFTVYGTVEKVRIVEDRDTGRVRGFAFVEMTQADAAEQAIRSVNGMLLNKRPLRVNEARPKLPEGRSHQSERGRDHRRHRI